jgi:hypothetical protein
MTSRWWPRWIHSQTRLPGRARPPQRFLPSLERLEDRALPSFAAPAVFTLPAAPAGVAAGHFEGTSAPLDLVTANADGTVFVLGGNGDGTFRVPENLHVGGSPTGVAVGDFLGNGRQDIVTANGNGTVIVLFSNGDGTFQSPTNLAIGAAPVGVAVGSFFGHGPLDIATANSNGTVTVLLGNGDGTFQAPITSSVGGTLTSLAVADFNGDGKPDLVVGSKTGLDVLLGNGDGTFFVKTVVTFKNEIGFTPVSSVAVADFRNNGIQDIVADTFSVTVLLGNGDGTLRSPVNFQAGGVAVGSLTLGDFNGDGKPDILTSNIAFQFGGGPSLTLFKGNGDGTFQGAGTAALGITGNTLVAADFRGIGKLDLALASASGSNAVTVVRGNGDGTFAIGQNLAANNLPQLVATGDFNRDGKPDLVEAGLAGNPLVFLNNGNGTFGAGIPLPQSGVASALAVGDFNGDGNPDIAISDQAGTIDVFLGNGDGTFRSPLPVTLGINTFVDSLATGDFNHDGRLDLVAVSNLSNTGQVAVLLGNGDGTFRRGQVFNGGLIAAGLAVGDFNGDGNLDLVTTTQLNSGLRNVQVFVGNRNGTFQAPKVFQPGGRSEMVGVGDFNGDGKPDLVLVDRFDNTVRVLLGNGNATFGNPITYQFATVLQRGGFAIGDFFGTGKLGVAVASDLGTVSVLQGDGDGTFQAAAVSLTDFHGSQPASVAAADFNGDGRVDLATTNALAGDVSVLRNTTPKPNVGTPVGTTTGLAADANPAVFGQPVTLTATVTSAHGTPTGTVTFLNGGTVLGEVAVDPTGHAVFTAAFGVGVQSLQASFAGTGAFTGSAGALSEKVNQAATTTTLTDFRYTANLFILQALVAPVAPGQGVPTGTVAFFDGSQALGTASMNGGGADLEVHLGSGTHHLTASYSGDANFLSSVSPVLIITIPSAALSSTESSSAVDPTAVGAGGKILVRSTVGRPAGIVAQSQGSIVGGKIGANVQDRRNQRDILK